MLLRDHLRYPNFVASAMAMSDEILVSVAHCAMDVHRDHHAGLDIGGDWRDHILALMLLRDCLGREAVRRGFDPCGPPMLARGWNTEDMYESLCPGPSGGMMPEWLLEWGEKQQRENTQ